MKEWEKEKLIYYNKMRFNLVKRSQGHNKV